MIGYECHAGLECRAVVIKNADKPLAAIIGRAFVSSENYRKGTERAISGDWSSYQPAEFFENILLKGSQSEIDKAAKRFESIAAATFPVRSKERWADAPVREAEQTSKSPSVVELNPVSEQNQILELETAHGTQPTITPAEKRTAEARAWRSFFSSLLKSDYEKASNSILEFLAHHYGFSSIVWLSNTGEQFENTATYGEMKNRRVRLGIAPDDGRLIEALRQEVPLELGERSKTGPGGRTMFMFPIGIGGHVSAALATLDPIMDEEVGRQIARICHSIAPQLEILRLRSEIARSETLAQAVRRFGESLKRIDNDDLWLTLTQNAAEMLGAERASMLVFNYKTESLEIKAMVGSTPIPPDDDEAGDRVAKIVFTNNEMVAITDVTRTGLLPAPPERKYKTASFLSCPISLSGRTIGVMNFTDRASGEAFGKNSIALFQAIAPQLAVAVDRALLKEKAGEFEQLSVTDALTGLLNRRYMEERLLEEVKRSNRHGFPMSYMMLDVDHFKSYNDEFGHPAGDEALRTVGHVIRETLRGADVAARYGGEEFSILLPQTTGDEAAAIAERIRANIEHANFTHREVTISIGVASCSAEVCSPKVLVSAADKALYEAKRRGRNKVLAFEAMPGKPAERKS
jgi:diguanylate cyclase (GGDEF)-like protein